MKSLGFEARRINGYNKYSVVLADPIRQQMERQKDAIVE